VRELENLIRRLAVLHAGETIPESAIAAELKEPPRASAAGDAGQSDSLSAAVEHHLTRYFAEHGDRLPPPGVYDRMLQELERPLLSICLAATRGNQIRAAHLLGLNRNTLRKKIRDLGLEVVRGLKPD
jgi:two-component system nitrogen regulation response regulator GlnG